MYRVQRTGRDYLVTRSDNAQALCIRMPDVTLRLA